MTPPRAFVLAGGCGTRLRPLTLEAPKPMLPFLTEPVLFGWLRRLADARIRRVHLLIGADPAPFSDVLALGATLGLRVSLHTETTPLRSAGAIRAALQSRPARVLVINADVVTDLPLQDLIDEHDRSGADATLAAVWHGSPTEFGVITASGRRIVRFDEKPPGRRGRALINAGIYVLGARVLDRLPPTGACDLESEVFPQLVSSELAVEVSIARSGWADLGTPLRYLTAHRAALDGDPVWPRDRRMRDLRPGVACHEKARVAAEATLHPPVVIGAGARVRASAVLGPHVSVGRDADVGRGAQLAETVVLERAYVPDGRQGRGLIIGHNHTVDASLHRSTSASTSCVLQESVNGGADGRGRRPPLDTAGWSGISQG